jgi:iron complex outermembrane receptor protein
LWAEDRLLDEPAIGVAPARGTVGVRYELPSRRFHGEATVNVLTDMGMDRVALTRGETPTDGYVTGDLRFGLQVSDQLLFRFGVENIADEFYVDHLNAKDPFTGLQVPEAGRVFYGKLSLAF